MRKIDDSTDERQKSWCVQCARPLAGTVTNNDHVPSKSLLVKPRPHNLPVVTICQECNAGFSLDEQYAVTLLSCVLAGSTDPEEQSNASAARALADSAALRARIRSSRSEYVTVGGETRILWKPEMDRIERVALKNARGHAYHEYGELMLAAPAHAWVRPFATMTVTERHDFELPASDGSPTLWPEVGSRMMTRLVTGDDMAGQWVVVQQGIYRYAVQQDYPALRVRSVWSEYLATEVQWEH